MGEAERVNIGVRVLTTTRDALDAAGERMGNRSRAFAIEVLAALYAHTLDKDTVVPIGRVPQDSRAPRKKAAKRGGKR